MAQTYTLEEAAQRLGISPDEFKRRLKDEWKQVRSFRDGATLRFRSTDIDELSRLLGEASDPGLGLGPIGEDSSGGVPADASGDFLLAPEPSGIKAPAGDHPLLLADEPEFSLAVDSGSKKHPKPDDAPTDSDVRLDVSDEPTIGVRPDKEPTEEIALDLSGPGSALIKPSQLSGPPSGKMAKPGSKLTGPPSSTRLGSPAPSRFSGPPSVKIPSPFVGNKPKSPADDSSEFELSLDADSDSFDLNLGDDRADSPPGGLGLSPSSQRGMQSGINLGKPADSGLSLERDGPKSGMLPKSGLAPKSGGPKSSGPKSGGRTIAGAAGAADESDIDFELTLDGPAASGSKSQSMQADSDSEFELTLDDDLSGSGLDDGPKTGVLDDEAKGDIFETDFELPAVPDGDDSASEVVAVDDNFDSAAETSDFDLAISDGDLETDEADSASQVVLVDDEPLIEEDAGAEVEVAEDTDTSPSASGALRGVSDALDDDEFAEPSGRAVPMAPAKWGALPAVVLFPCLLFTFLGGMMSFELLRGMWGYHQSSPPQNMIVKAVADNLGMKTSD